MASATVASSSSGPKRAVHLLMVAEATVDDDSACALHPCTMTKLSIFHGDAVLFRSKRRGETVCIAMLDEQCGENKVKINKAVRSKLRVRLADVVSVQACHGANYQFLTILVGSIFILSIISLYFFLL